MWQSMAKTLSGYRSPRESCRALLWSGPALFVLFLNDMPCAVSQCSTLALFADNAKCFRTVRSASDCVLFRGDID